MTIATDRGFEIGKLYRVINDKNSSYYKVGMIVKLIRDDDSNCPLFELISGEPMRAVQDGCYYIDLCDLEPVESTGFLNPTVQNLFSFCTSSSNTLMTRC